ncbi:non-specific serine/threonine protein kinase [Acididesulfobacillus acetoxydans]|uniref:Anti-sigma F factor n=1 Tax=Acididesulfobacillus acetoxydans TaxID=1561005 RepID=A0A8S0Y3H9_9FIRM|nr:anti-sigma F factor [Acididesulfobacillus acetoxydans]CAA7602085.1 non-specific serine/threonine protein kinase [Acididesulfobacillus acetoxydans]CEJ08072.1 Anti-sigma F factor [Acididesulfobacillus acetoxydans]
MKENQLTLSFSSLAENVGIARMLIASVGAQLDFPINDIEELKVAVSEAVSNAIIHGYHGRSGHVVLMELEIDDDALKITVSDEGCGIPDVVQAMQPAYSTDPERMGLGFVFMQSFMDELHVDSAVDKGTTVSMVKLLNRAASSPSR